MLATRPPVIGLFIASILISGCALKANRTLKGVSPGEAKVLTEDPFVHSGNQGSGQNDPSFDPNSVLTGIEGEQASSKYNWKNEDSLWAVNEPATLACSMDTPATFIRHCDPAMYEVELKEAMEAAAADPDKRTVVVRYSVSLGTPLDDTAFTAYNRTVLRVSDDGVTPIPVGPAESLNHDDYQGSRAFHYFADHVIARNEYISGKKCYFHTVKLFANETGPVMHAKDSVEHSLPGASGSSKYYDHTMNILYYGDAYPCSGAQDCYRRYLSPRLFKKNDKVTNDIIALLNDFKTNNLQNLKLSEFVRQCPGDRQPQIIPLYVADFREQRLAEENVGKLIDRDFANSANRRFEYEVKLKKIFDLKNIFWNREKMQVAWWHAKKIGNYCFAPYVGVAQLLDNMIFGGTNGTVLSTQYTPIVLDLPIGSPGDEYESNRHIHTSSVNWGTFFNLLNLMWKKPTGEVTDIHHLTAWVGGKLVKRDPAAVQTNCATCPPPPPPCTTGDCGFLPTGGLTWVREATDGFLVIADVLKDSSGNELKCSDGSPKYDVPRGEHLFGAYAQVDGKFTEYNNGFQKLRAWVNSHGGVAKSCTQTTTCKTSDDMKSRYFGPWDGAAWLSVKVWLDKNRDGKVDCGEMMSLTQAKVAALNTCQFEYRSLANGELLPSEDAYRNATHLRAAFLVDETGLGLTDAEALKRIQTGNRSDGKPAEFRVAIDVLFKSRPGLFLEDAPDAEIVPLKDLATPSLP